MTITPEDTGHPEDRPQSGDGAGGTIVHRNHVLLVGRVPADPQTRVLPSGDELVQFRLVVARPPVPEPASVPRRQTVDTIDCVAWEPQVREAVEAWVVGDTVQVEGSLRRRFWRTGAGPASRSEVEVHQGQVVGGELEGGP